MNIKFIYIILIIIFIILILFKIFNKNLNEPFLVTWTPYIIDNYYQPGYSNYFYHNNYMYPVY